MSNNNVAAVRNAYAVAERKDLEGWINLFAPDGVFVDNSVGATYRGRALADPVRNYGAAFSNMHRELYRIYADGNVVVVQLALQGTHDGPLQLPFGELSATGKKMYLAHNHVQHTVDARPDEKGFRMVSAAALSAENINTSEQDSEGSIGIVQQSMSPEGSRGAAA